MKTQSTLIKSTLKLLKEITALNDIIDSPEVSKKYRPVSIQDIPIYRKYTLFGLYRYFNSMSNYFSFP